MWRLLQSLFDLVLPRKERVARVDSYALEDIGLSPADHATRDVTITTLMSYRTKAVDDLVRALKYDHAARAATLLADALADYLKEEIPSLKTFSTKEIVLVPVPLHPSRMKERGYNQMELVLAALPKEFKDGTVSRVANNILVRTRATEQQTQLARDERLKNMRDAFAVLNNVSVHTLHIVLIDDVSTTGATLAEAGRPLERAGARVTRLALARA